MTRITPSDIDAVYVLLCDLIDEPIAVAEEVAPAPLLPTPTIPLRPLPTAGMIQHGTYWCRWEE